jgi:twitching motility two-component system response regulator PilH
MTTDSLKSILNKTANICVVAETLQEEEKIKSALQICGFNAPKIVRSIDTLDEINNGEKINIDWLILIRLSETTTKPNDFLIKKSTRTAGNQYLVSFFYAAKSSDDTDAIAESGLGSWHRVSEPSNRLENEISSLLDKIRLCNSSMGKLTNGYLRDDLLKSANHNKLLNFDQTMIDHFPNDPRLLLNLAESNFLSKNIDAAITLLVQAKNMDSRLSTEIATLYAKIKETKATEQTSTNTTTQTNQKFVIIESDQSVVTQIKKLLEGFGIKNPTVLDNGEKAWNWLENNPEPELIITEWKLPGLLASPLIQRIRQLGFYNVPIMVCSSKVTQEEMPLFKEFSISHLIKKPTSERELAIAVKWVMQQHAHPTNQTSLEKEIALAIKRKDWTKAKNLKAAYLANQKVLDSRKKLLEAEFLYHEQKYSSAVDTAKVAAKLSEIDSLDFVDLMARCQLQLGDHVAASRFLEVAVNLSPQNVSRLCDLAHVNTLIGTPQNSEKILQLALHIDRGRSDVIESVSKWSLAIDNHEKVEKIMEHVQDKLKIIAHFNNRAVQLTQQHQNEQALKIYKLILKVVPQDKPEMKARIEYNLALGLVKIGKFAQALQILSQCNCKQFPNVYMKAESLRTRTQDALREIQKMQLNDAHTAVHNQNLRQESGAESLTIMSELQILEALLHSDETPEIQTDKIPNKKSVA